MLQIWKLRGGWTVPRTVKSLHFIVCKLKVSFKQCLKLTTYLSSSRTCHHQCVFWWLFQLWCSLHQLLVHMNFQCFEFSSLIWMVSNMVRLLTLSCSLHNKLNKKWAIIDINGLATSLPQTGSLGSFCPFWKFLPFW